MVYYGKGMTKTTVTKVDISIFYELVLVQVSCQPDKLLVN